jgi:predicted metal-dependent peptidase
MVPFYEEYMTEKEQILQRAIYRLFYQEQFYGALLQELTIRFLDAVPTAAIAYNRKKQEYQIVINYEFFAKLTDEERTAVLKHEILHFTNGHLIRFPWNEDTPKDKKYQYNLAGDMAINQFINGLPKDCIDVSAWKKNDGTPFPKFQTMEVYFDLIQNNLEANKDLMNGPDGEGDEEGECNCEGKEEGSNGKKHKKGCGKGKKQHVLDSHDWNELTDEEKKDCLKETGKIFERAMEKNSFGYDIVPQYVKDLLREIESTINGLNYKKILKDTIKRTVCCSDRDSTWNRRNKRYGQFAPGTKNGTLPECALMIDTSGSISTTEMNEFLQVVSGFLKAGSRKCTLGLWHQVLYHTQKYKLNQKIEESVLESGGTEVTSVLEYVVKHNPNLTCILTDGYFGLPDIKISKASEILWIISKNGNTDKNFLDSLPGKHIKMS